MSSNNTYIIFLQINDKLRLVLSALKIGFQQVVNALYKTAQIKASIDAINKGKSLASSSLFKDRAGLTGKGGSISMQKVNEIIGNIFAGNDDLFKGLGGGSVAGKKGLVKDLKGASKVIKGIGGGLKASFGPMALGMTLLAPLISGMLLPITTLNPILTAVGTQLGLTFMPLTASLIDMIVEIMPQMILYSDSLTPINDSLIALLPTLTLLISAFSVLVGSVGLLAIAIGGAIVAVTGGEGDDGSSIIGNGIIELKSWIVGLSKFSNTFGSVWSSLMNSLRAGTGVRRELTAAEKEAIAIKKEENAVIEMKIAQEFEASGIGKGIYTPLVI